MINKIAGSMAIVGLLMLIFMIVYVELYKWWELSGIVVGAFIFVAPWASMKFLYMLEQMNPPEGE